MGQVVGDLEGYLDGVAFAGPGHLTHDLLSRVAAGWGVLEDVNEVAFELAVHELGTATEAGQHLAVLGLVGANVEEVGVEVRLVYHEFVAPLLCPLGLDLLDLLLGNVDGGVVWPLVQRLVGLLGKFFLHDLT